MYYIVESDKPFTQASMDLELAVVHNGYGVLHVHDVGATLRSKGITFNESCRIFEVCNPNQAEKVMASDMRLNMALPCRISVYTEKGKTKIGVIRPAQILKSLSSDPALAGIAEQVEEAVVRMVDEAR